MDLYVLINTIIKSFKSYAQGLRNQFSVIEFKAKPTNRKGWLQTQKQKCETTEYLSNDFLRNCWWSCSSRLAEDWRQNVRAHYWLFDWYLSTKKQSTLKQLQNCTIPVLGKEQRSVKHFFIIAEEKRILFLSVISSAHYVLVTKCPCLVFIQTESRQAGVHLPKYQYCFTDFLVCGCLQ